MSTQEDKSRQHMIEALVTKELLSVKPDDLDLAAQLTVIEVFFDGFSPTVGDMASPITALMALDEYSGEFSKPRFPDIPIVDLQLKITKMMSAVRRPLIGAVASAVQSGILNVNHELMDEVKGTIMYTHMSAVVDGMISHASDDSPQVH